MFNYIPISLIINKYPFWLKTIFSQKIPFFIRNFRFPWVSRHSPQKIGFHKNFILNVIKVHDTFSITAREQTGGHALWCVHTIMQFSTLYTKLYRYNMHINLCNYHHIPTLHFMRLSRCVPTNKTVHFTDPVSQVHFETTYSELH